MRKFKLKLETKVMRKSISLLMLALFLACNTGKSQISKKQDATFESQLRETMSSINSSKSIKDLFGNINKLKRLSTIYPNEWLSDYYVALLDIKISMAIKDTEKKKALLDEAKERLAIIKSKENTIESEILTLDGYYYYAIITSNPQKNGRLYYKDVIGAFQKAKAIDKNNPRPVLMLSVFQKKMSASTGGDSSGFCDELSQAEQMFERFSPINEVYPKWGLEELKKHQQESCN